jgi:hypothetical protein
MLAETYHHLPDALIHTRSDRFIGICLVVIGCVEVCAYALETIFPIAISPAFVYFCCGGLAFAPPNLSCVAAS